MTGSVLARVLRGRVVARRRGLVDPAFLISWMRAPDEGGNEQDTFSFSHLREPLGSSEVRVHDNTLLPWPDVEIVDAPTVGLERKSWRWQRDVVDLFHGSNRSIVLKARQIGITWLACAYVVWVCLARPGSTCLVYRQKGEDAEENVGRCWALFLSLPAWLRFGGVVEKPSRIEQPVPTEELRLRFPNGRASRIIAMTAATSAGHGKTAAVVLTDEFAHMDNAASIMKAVQPAAGRHGKILVVSTANGVSDPETGAGNHFHYVWSDDGNGYARRFLGWWLHPHRDKHWYENDPEIRSLTAHGRAEQHPSTEDEAFTLTNQTFFDPSDLAFYGGRVAAPSHHLDFERVDASHAKIRKHDRGATRVYAEPQPGVRYAIGADVATGRGRDYSAAYVIDLSEMRIAAEFHARLDADLFAYQLHYLGKWYNDALVAVETAGGYGDTVNIELHKGKDGRPPYPKLYRHVLSSRPDFAESKPFGFPTNSKTRPLILNQLEKAIRERTLPSLTRLFLNEARTFVYRDSGTSPRAQDGARDDCVMALAIALEMYRLRGEHPDRRRKVFRRPLPSPFQKAA